LHGPTAAQGFYDQLTADLATELMTPTREQYGEDFCVDEPKPPPSSKAHSLASPATAAG
jgi:hypothetical protein